MKSISSRPFSGGRFCQIGLEVIPKSPLILQLQGFTVDMYEPSSLVDKYESSENIGLVQS